MVAVGHSVVFRRRSPNRAGGTDLSTVIGTLEECTADADTATFTPTTVSGGSATGSFSGGATVGIDAASDVAESCRATRGITSLNLAGTIRG